MTKQELREHLKIGGIMEDAFKFGPGQDCEIFKADRFEPGYKIIYIPDLMNVALLWDPITDDEVIDEVVDNCYTWYDFVELCGGDINKAERLFWYCDWQHPSSALPEVEDEEE